MPLLLPENHPAAAALTHEGLPLLSPAASRGCCGGRPLRVGLLNLMPRKTVTDVQFARVLGSGWRMVELVFLLPPGYRSESTAADYLEAFYRTWDPSLRLDALIVTGAPLERLAFAEVTYWQALTRIFDWAATSVGSTLAICWAGQALLHHAHGVEKHLLPEKLSGVYQQQVSWQGHPLLRGLDRGFAVPVSRHTSIRAAELPAGRGLALLAGSPETGPCLVEDAPRRAFAMFNHLEYDGDTLLREYLRDREAGLPARPPVGLLSPGLAAGMLERPPATWRPSARRFFSNWLDLVASASLQRAA